MRLLLHLTYKDTNMVLWFHANICMDVKNTNRVSRGARRAAVVVAARGRGARTFITGTAAAEPYFF
eukprot:SAG31_NODE_1076_length_10037_cov_8.357818_1_plen_66_part_00